MTALPVPAPRACRAHQSVGEEIANSLTHGCGLAAGLAGAPVLVTLAARGDAWQVAGTSVFASTLVLLYAVSTVYHALPPSRGKRLMRRLDHAAIYLLIAGTYTPFTLGPLRGAWGWALFGTIWSLALTGLAFKFAVGCRFGRLSTAVYLAMGWICLVAVHPLVTRVPTGVLVWLVAGGLLYSGGIVFYAARGIRYGHAVWHVFVLAGSACHFVGVLSSLN